MTELIVALDGPSRQFRLACDLIEKTKVSWLKVGPQLITSPDFVEFTAGANAWPGHVKIFLDLKLADTADTVRETVKYLADVGISAVSTSTLKATAAAVAATIQAGAFGRLKVWQVILMSDDVGLPIRSLALRCPGANGVICPGVCARVFQGSCDVVVPGVRFPGAEPHGHTHTCTPQEAVAAGATHIVVGRPIWQADNPVAAAKEYLAAIE